MSGTSQKTPISVLNELVLKLKISLSGQYIDVPIGTSSLVSVRSPPIFVYEYLCNNYIARGEGTAKKRAQHNAAEKMLKILEKSPDFGSAFPRDNISISSPSEIKVEKDAVGPLTDFCAEYSLPVPEYQTVREEGPAHDRRFTSRCFIPSFGVEATDRQKKQAKQQVALKMLTILKNTIECRLNREIAIAHVHDFLEALKKFPNSRTGFNTKYHAKDLCTPLITDFTRYQNYHNLIKEALEEFAELEYVNPEKMLDSILQKIEINYSLVGVFSENNEDFIITLNIYFSPDLAVCELGASYVDASKNAARKAVDYIKILCSPPKNIQSNIINDVVSKS